ncbi:biotin/lipoyl-containing protein [Ferroglobus sp.]|uniref:biotin/lipoyl-containing protein n=1 Tax=Ferroglobus sp. TaxID=2614230 RepID=UPI0025B854F3|nr:biotin/lipoyl-containing protein [Ferroglobus sp.]
MKYKIKVNDNEYEVEVSEISPMKFEVSVNGKKAVIEILEEEFKRIVKEAKVPSAEVEVKEVPKVEKTVVEGKEIKAEMSGTIVKVLVKEGEEVKSGQPVLILEAMKMENEVTSPFSGVVKEVRVKEGDRVNAGQTLVVIG